jgi:DNA uptake protein ComE-like DNA-binding protein
MKRSNLLRVGMVGAAVGFLSLIDVLAQTSAEPSRATAAADASRNKIDLNTAEIPALEALPEIGAEFANAVVSGRPYKSVDDLARVVKLPPEKLATLRGRRKRTTGRRRPARM